MHTIFWAEKKLKKCSWKKLVKKSVYTIENWKKNEKVVKKHAQTKKKFSTTIQLTCKVDQLFEWESFHHFPRAKWKFVKKLSFFFQKFYFFTKSYTLYCKKFHNILTICCCQALRDIMLYPRVNYETNALVFRATTTKIQLSIYITHTIESVTIISMK